MITRFYVDNYKCLSNFEYKPKQLDLIVGANGTGKTTVFEALRRLQEFIAGDIKADELFLTNSITRWQKRGNQVFELEVEDEGNNYHYSLEISHDLERESTQVHEEKLRCNDNVLFAFGRRWENEETEEGTAHYLVGELWIHERVGIEEMSWSNGNRSILSAFGKRDIPRSIQFQERVRNTYFAKLNPVQMDSFTKAEMMRPSTDFSDFSSWYRYLVQEKPSAIFKLYESLREVIEGFQELKFDTYGESARQLKVLLQTEPNNTRRVRPSKYDFEELSDGQRALIALYALLFCSLDTNTTLVIDEPENYIALRELQPWLMLLQERLEEHGGQVILISHHPEFINALASSNTVIFERANGGPVRIKEFDSKSAATLSPAELMARGWEGE